MSNSHGHELNREEEGGSRRADVMASEHWRTSDALDIMRSGTEKTTESNALHASEVRDIRNRHNERLEELTAFSRGVSAEGLTPSVSQETSVEALERLRDDELALRKGLYEAEKDTFTRWRDVLQRLDAMSDAAPVQALLDLVHEQDNVLDRYLSRISEVEPSFDRKITKALYSGASAESLSGLAEQRRNDLVKVNAEYSGELGRLSRSMDRMMDEIARGHIPHSDGYIAPPTTGELVSRLQTNDLQQRANALRQLTLHTEPSAFRVALRETGGVLGREAGSAAVEIFMRAPDALSGQVAAAIRGGEARHAARFTLALRGLLESGQDSRAPEACKALNRALQDRPEEHRELLRAVRQVTTEAALAETRGALTDIVRITGASPVDVTPARSVLEQIAAAVQSPRDEVAAQAAREAEQLRESVLAGRANIEALTTKTRSLVISGRLAADSDEVQFFEERLIQPVAAALSSSSYPELVSALSRAGENVGAMAELYQSFKVERISESAETLAQAGQNEDRSPGSPQTAALYAVIDARRQSALDSFAALKRDHDAGLHIEPDRLLAAAREVRVALLEQSAVSLHAALDRTHLAMLRLEQDTLLAGATEVRSEVGATAQRLEQYLRSGDDAAIARLMNSRDMFTLSSRASDEFDAQQQRQLMGDFALVAASAVVGGLAVSAVRAIGVLAFAGEAVAAASSTRLIVIGLELTADGAAQAVTASSIRSGLRDKPFDIRTVLLDTASNVAAGALVHGLTAGVLDKIRSASWSPVLRQGADSAVTVSVTATVNAGLQTVQTGELPDAGKAARDAIVGWVIGRAVGSALDHTEVRHHTAVAELVRDARILTGEHPHAGRDVRPDVLLNQARDTVRAMEQRNELSTQQGREAETAIDAARVLAAAIPVGRLTVGELGLEVRYTLRENELVAQHPEVAAVIEEAGKTRLRVAADLSTGGVGITDSNGNSVLRLVPERAAKPAEEAAEPRSNAESRFAQRAYAGTFADTPAIKRLWSEAAQGKQKSESGFDAARRKFWFQVNHGASDDARQVQAILREAGFLLQSGESAPVLALATRAKSANRDMSFRTLSLDHIDPKSRAKDVILDPANLRFLLTWDNSVRGARFGVHDYPVGDPRNTKTNEKEP